MQALPSSIASWVKTGLAVIGVLAIVVHGGPAVLRALGSDEFDVLREFPSPDGQFKAVLFNANGGGGLSPYCYDAISIIPARSKPNGGDESQRVYLAGCHSFVDPVTNNRTNGPEVRWLANNRVQIHFSVNQGSRGVAQLLLKGFADAGRIYVSYVVSESGM